MLVPTRSRSKPATLPARRAVPVLALALAAGGCDRRPAVVRLTYVPSTPAGATYTDTAVAAPLLRHLFPVAGAAHVAAVSTAGSVDVYVVATPDADLARLASGVRDAVAATAADLPAGGRVAAVVILPRGTAVPSAPAGQIDQFVVQVDRAKSAAAGVSTSDIETALSQVPAMDPTRPASADQIPALNDVRVPTVRGGSARLGDLATVILRAEPTAVRRDF